MYSDLLLPLTLGKMARSVASREQWKAEQVIRVLAVNSRGVPVASLLEEGYGCWLL